MKKIIAKIFIGLVLSFAFATNAVSETKTELTIGISQEFGHLNNHVTSHAASSYIYAMVNRFLVTVDPDWKWVCELCVEIPTFENGKARFIEEGGVKKVVADWEIKENAKWGDGTPVTAFDFKLAWEVGKSPNVETPLKETFTNIEDVQIDGQNPKKFTIKYALADYSYFQLGTFSLLPAHIEKLVWEKVKDESGGYGKQTKYNTDPTNPGLYSGPYVVDEIKLGSHVILKPNPYFYGNKPKIQKIVIKFIQDTSTLEANLLSGTIDMISELGLEFDQALSIQKRFAKEDHSQYQVLFKEALVYEHIDVNLENPILKDIKVRQALLYGLDRDKLVKSLFEGKLKKALHETHPLDFYFTDEVEKYDYDPKKAEGLLEASGWKKGSDGYRYKNSERLALTIMTTAGNKTRELAQVYMQDQWKKIGVELKIKNEPARVFFGETVQKRKYQHLALYAFISGPDNPPATMYDSENIPTEANGWSGQNRAAWVNAKVDAAFDKIRVEFDVNKRKELMKVVLQQFTQELPQLPLYMRVENAVIPTNLKGLRLTGHQFYSGHHVEDWYF